jgi:thiamine pyrophosphokinase
MPPPEAATPVVLVVGGGGPPHPGVAAHLPAGPARVLAADSGLDHALALGLRVDVVVGDLDSVAPGALDRAATAGTAVDRHPRAKDHTDLELALVHAWAVAGPGGSVLVVGDGAGRLDHALAALLLLAHPAGEAVHTRALLGPAEVVVVRPALAWHLDGPAGQLLTLVPVGGVARGITTAGLRYHLRDEALDPGSTRGVSNELAGGPASVALREGVLLGLRPELLGPA